MLNRGDLLSCKLVLLPLVWKFETMVFCRLIWHFVPCSTYCSPCICTSIYIYIHRFHEYDDHECLWCNQAVIAPQAFWLDLCSGQDSGHMSAHTVYCFTGQGSWSFIMNGFYHGDTDCFVNDLNFQLFCQISHFAAILALAQMTNCTIRSQVSNSASDVD